MNNDNNNNYNNPNNNNSQENGFYSYTNYNNNDDNVIFDNNRRNDSFNQNFDNTYFGASNTTNDNYADYSNNSAGNNYNDYSNNYNEYSNSYNPHNNNKKKFRERFKRNSNKVQKESQPILLTRKKFALILLLVILLAFGGAFSGMFMYNSLYPSGNNNKNQGSIKGDGYSLTGATGSPMTVDEIVEQNLDTVVQIRTESVSSDFWVGEYVTEGAGSGVIIKDNGYIVTNNHVIDGASTIYVTLSNKKEYQAKLIGKDAENDLAVLKINANGLPAATYGNSDELTVGNLSVIIGNPLGKLGGTVTAGIISSLDRQITLDGQPMTLLQTDASVNPGNSGGAMFDQYGHLVGIVVAKSSGSDVEGLGFAIPINKAADIISQLMKNGKAVSTTGYSGMTYAQTETGSIVIVKVNEEFAQKAGFKPNDMVLAIDDTVIDSMDTLTTTIKTHKIGDTVTYTIGRRGKQMQIDLKLEQKK